jgi:hypothetical protein
MSQEPTCLEHALPFLSKHVHMARMVSRISALVMIFVGGIQHHTSATSTPLLPDSGSIPAWMPTIRSSELTALVRQRIIFLLFLSGEGRRAVCLSTWVVVITVVEL